MSTKLTADPNAFMIPGDGSWLAEALEPVVSGVVTENHWVHVEKVVRAVGMTEEERFRFDLAGFFVRPSILTEDEISSISEQLDRIHHNPESLPPEQRCVPGGASSVLIDHPRVMDVLDELIGLELGVRLESAISMWRTKGDSHGQGLHSGGPTQSHPIFGFRVQDGRIYPGMMRVIFELGPVSSHSGATQFLVGSHKSNFAVHPDHASLDPETASPFLMS